MHFMTNIVIRNCFHIFKPQTLSDMLYHTGTNNQLLLLEASVSADWKTWQLHFLLHQRHIMFSTAELAHTNEHKTHVVDKDVH